MLMPCGKGYLSEVSHLTSLPDASREKGELVVSTDMKFSGKNLLYFLSMTFHVCDAYQMKVIETVRWRKNSETEERW